jgi:integrase
MQKSRGIFKRGGVYWISYFDAGGQRHREKIGSRLQAQDAVERRRQEVKNGTYIPPSKHLTFRALALLALKEKKLQLKPSSYSTDEGRLRSKVYPLIGGVLVDRLGPVRIQETLNTLQATVCKSTVNRYRSLLGSIFAYAVRTYRLPTNPVSRVKRFPETGSRIRWLTDDEEARLRKTIDTLAHEAEFDLALHTGMRRGEQFFLKWAHCDIERGNLDVDGKTGPRHVTANKTAKKALRFLQEISGEGEFVCPEASANVTRDWRRWLEKAIKDARIRNFRWHDLRHTYASRLVMSGVDLRTVQTLMGHKQIAMTMKYAHLAKGQEHSAVEKLVARKEEAPMKDDKKGNDKSDSGKGGKKDGG